MGSAWKRNFRWSETARLQLVEAVIKTEEEIRQESNGISNGISKPRPKWTRVARLLPLLLRRGRNYSEDKCRHMFFNLLKIYKHKLAGKTTKCSLLTMTQPVWEIIKRREELLNGPTPTSIQFRVAEMDVVKGRRPPGQSRRKMREPEWKSVKRPENLLKPSTSIRPERLKDPVKNDGFKRIPINWTETALVQLVEAVTKVEEEIMKEPSRARRPSTGKRMGKSNRVTNSMGRKWNRVADLLPLDLQAKSWSPSVQMFSGEMQCRRKFAHIWKIYRDILAGRTTKKPPLEMRTTVWELLKRRENLLKARSSIGAENSLNSEASSNGGHSSAGQSIGTSQPAASLSSKHDNAEVLGFHSNLERYGIERHGQSIQTNNADPSRGHASRPSSEFEDSENQNQTPIFTRVSTSRSLMESADRDAFGKPSSLGQPLGGGRTKAQTRERQTCSNSSRRPALNGRSRVYFRSEGTCFTPGRDEIQDVVPQRLLRSLDREFAGLSSWIQSRSVQLGDNLIHEMRTNCEKRSRKRCKVSVHSGEGRVTNHFEEIFQTSLTRIIDHKIRASFLKLRIWYAEELKTASVELARKVLRETQELYTYPGTRLPLRGNL